MRPYLLVMLLFILGLTLFPACKSTGPAAASPGTGGVATQPPTGTPTATITPIAGPNIYPYVEDFSISQETFTAASHDVALGCLTPGKHRLLRFSSYCYNSGTADIVVGNPADRPDLFTRNPADGQYYAVGFLQFKLFDSTSTLLLGSSLKATFCLADDVRVRADAAATAQFTDCHANQGISAGWSDEYESNVSCQFIVLDGLPDGTYKFMYYTNSQQRVPEATYADNSGRITLHITGTHVTADAS